MQAGIKRRVRAAPTKSLRRIAHEANVDKDIVRTLVKKQGWKSLRRVKVPLISAAGREKKCRDRAQRLMNKLKNAAKNQIKIFSDKKTFDVDPAYNPQ